MSDLHANHDHKHGPDCEHTGVKHGDHVDYLHDGHMHHVREDGQIEYRGFSAGCLAMRDKNGVIGSQVDTVFSVPGYHGGAGGEAFQYRPFVPGPAARWRPPRRVRQGGEG